MDTDKLPDLRRKGFVEEVVLSWNEKTRIIKLKAVRMKMTS